MKKLQLLLQILLFSIIAFISCKNDKKNITLIGEDSSTIQSIASLKEVYEKQNDIKVNTLGYSFDDAFEKTNVDFSTKTGKYDIIMQYNFSLSSYVRNNYVYLLDDLKKEYSDLDYSFEDDLFENVWKEVGYYDLNNNGEGKAIAYPFAANTMVLAYNVEMFNNEENKLKFKKMYNRELTVPDNWYNFKQVASFFTDASKNTFGVCLQGSASGWLYYEWTNFAFGMGGGTSNKKRGWGGDELTKITLNSKENINATELYISLKPYNKGAFYDVDMNLQAESFKEGNVAMAIMWSDVIYPVMKGNNPEFDKRFAYTTIPGNVSMLAGGGFFINKNSKNPDIAFDFLTWIFEEKTQIALAMNGLCSPRKSIYDREELKNIPYLQAVKKSLDRGVFMLEAGPDADLINQKISTYLQKAWKGELSVKEALDKAQEELEKERVSVYKAL